jgi:hypothetical protein
MTKSKLSPIDLARALQLILPPELGSPVSKKRAGQMTTTTSLPEVATALLEGRLSYTDALRSCTDQQALHRAIDEVAASRGMTVGERDRLLGWDIEPEVLGEPWMGWELEEAGRKLLARALNRVFHGKNIPLRWSGPELTWSELLVGGPTIEADLSEEGLEANRERGRDVLGVVIVTLLRIGYEQGARIYERRAKQFDTGYVRRAREVVKDYFEPQLVTSPVKADKQREELRRLFETGLISKGWRARARDHLKQYKGILKEAADFLDDDECTDLGGKLYELLEWLQKEGDEE